MTINQFMTQDHRACDGEFAEVENSVDKQEYQKALSQFEKFQAHMLKHFAMEEEVMFKEFNNSNHEGCNPTGVMKMEHDQMRHLLSQMQISLDASDKERFLGLSENLHFVMQQHNMKEEQIMYNLADSALDANSIIAQMESCHG